MWLSPSLTMATVADPGGKGPCPPTGPVKISQFVHINADDLILMKDVENHDRLFNI